MADVKKNILLRISPDLWSALNILARDELRSLNAQIEFLLREAVRKRGLLPMDAPIAEKPPAVAGRPTHPPPSPERDDESRNA